MSQLDQGRQLNAFAQTQTIFSGADPAIAQLEGGAGVLQGTDPTDYAGAVLGSWARSGQPGGSRAEASTTNAGGLAGALGVPSDVTTGKPYGILETFGLILLAVALVLIGAFAMVGQSPAALAA